MKMTQLHKLVKVNLQIYFCTLITLSDSRWKTGIDAAEPGDLCILLPVNKSLLSQLKSLTAGLMLLATDWLGQNKRTPLYMNIMSDWMNELIEMALQDDYQAYTLLHSRTFGRLVCTWISSKKASHSWATVCWWKMKLWKQTKAKHECCQMGRNSWPGNKIHLPAPVKLTN